MPQNIGAGSSGTLPNRNDDTTTTTQTAQPAVTNVDIAPAGSAAAPAPAQPAAAPAAAAAPAQTGVVLRPDPSDPTRMIWWDTATNAKATPTQAAQATSQAAGQAQPSVGQPGAGGLFTVDQTTQQAAKEVQDANVQVAGIWQQINDQQKVVDEIQAGGIAGDPTGARLQGATSTLNTLYGTLSSAEQRLMTANATYSTGVTKAIDQNLVDPSQVAVAQANAAKANADSDTAKAQAQVLTDGAPGQRALVAAQAGLASAQAASAQATADATAAKTPAEAAQLNAQAAALNAQANQTNTLLPGLVDKQAAETGLTQAQITLTGSQSDLAKAQATQAGAQSDLINAQAAQTRATTGQLLPAQVGLTQAQAGLAGAQAGLAGAQATGQLAGAAGQLATIQQNLQGPLYGLQDRINAIKQIQGQVFGPGGSGDPNEANDLLRQFTESTIGGTTPYAANVAAANAGLTAFGTQASLTNAAQSALAQRASALGAVGSNALSTLAALNANAPKGSTALAAAFNDVVNLMASKMNTGALAPPPQPTAPALPPYLQRLVYGGGGAPPGGAPGAAAAAPPPPAAAAPPPAAPAPGGNYNPQAPPMPAVPPPGAPTGPIIPGQPPPAAPPAAPPPITPGMSMFSPGQQPQTSAPITINVGTQTPAGPAPPPPSPAASMPAVIAQHAPATVDAVHQIWSKELSSGAVTSPMATGVNPNGSAAGPVGLQVPNTEPTQVAAQGGVQPLTTGSQPPVNTWPGVTTGSQPPVNTWTGVPGNALSLT
jgi:hypothetical protein